MPVIKLPLDPGNNTINMGQLYFLYNKDVNKVTIGIWNENDIEDLDLKDLLDLRKFIDNKIFKILMKTV